GLLDERFGDEGFSGAHGAGEEHSHRAAIAPSLTKVVGDQQELLFHLLDPSDHREIVRRLDELDEPEAFALDDLPLTLENEIDGCLLGRRVAAPPAGGLRRQQSLELDDLEPGRDLGEAAEPGGVK